MFVDVTPEFRSTWRGRPGASQTYHLDRNDYGLRVTVHRWLDGSNEAIIKLIKGDGRSPQFRKYAEMTTTIDKLTLDYVASFADEHHPDKQQFDDPAGPSI